ncbi:MAG TPA: 2-oxoglutarate and iron-dependent oxygenase domain-containing protein [Rhodopila sp.]
MPTETEAASIGGIIPVLDVAPFLAGEPGARERLGRELRHAFENVGFYYLRGHGVPPSLIEATFAEAKRFHAQAIEAKLALKINEHNVGYMPMRGSVNRTSQVNNNTRPSVNEAFFIRRERTPDDPDVIANKKLRGLNQWPADLPGFREALLRYVAVMETLGRKLVPLYAEALELPPDWFDAMFELPNTILRLSHYPAQPTYDDNEFSIAPHTDSGFMTLLAPNEVPGLSIRLPNGEWFDAPSVPDAYVVNGGDILRRWTNERFLSTPHRVINAAGKPRYAIPFFFDPHPDTMIKCLPTCACATNPPKYEPITYDQYAIWFANRNYLHQPAAEPEPAVA